MVIIAGMVIYDLPVREIRAIATRSLINAVSKTLVASIPPHLQTLQSRDLTTPAREFYQIMLQEGPAAAIDRCCAPARPDPSRRSARTPDLAQIARGVSSWRARGLSGPDALSVERTPTPSSSATGEAEGGGAEPDG
jgi:hypothetical protein